MQTGKKVFLTINCYLFIYNNLSRLGNVFSSEIQTFSLEMRYFYC